MSASKQEINNRLDQLIENSILVDVAKFESMLVSNQNLERSDFRSDNTRGVYDPESRTRYFVHENELFPFAPPAASLAAHPPQN